MKFFALEVENQPINWNEVDPGLLKAEARCLFDLQQADLIRQVYFTADTKSAVIEWECDSIEKVCASIETFPLVKAGLIHFNVIPLVPYSGFNRLFG
jgi:hypothetical protein